MLTNYTNKAGPRGPRGFQPQGPPIDPMKLKLPTGLSSVQVLQPKKRKRKEATNASNNRK